MKPAEGVEVVEFSGVPPVVVDHVQPDPVTEYAAPAAAVSDAALAPVVDYIAPAPSRGGDSIGVS